MMSDDQQLSDLAASLPKARYFPLYLGGLILFIVLGLASIGVLAAGLRKGGDMVVCAMAAFLTASVFGLLLGLHLERVRSQGLAVVAAHLGMDHVRKPARAARAALFRPFAGLKMLRHGHKGVKLWFGGDVDGHRIDLVEHAYVVSTGKSAHVVTHTAVGTPVPAAWPRLSLSSRHALASWWASMTGKDFKVENEAFNARWIVKTDNPDFAILFLTPEVQQFLASAPGSETWHVGDGSLCWLLRKQLKPRDIVPPMLRVIALRDLLPPELEYWGSGTAA